MVTKAQDSNLKIFSLDSNRPLAEKIAKHMGVPLGKVNVDHFSDGEIKINIEESVRGNDVYIIQSTSAPVNDNLMELLIMVDALRRASAATINVVIPYYGYARQDRKALLVMYRITDTATAFSTALSCSSRGMRWRYSPTMWKMDTPFVSARRTWPCFVSRQNLKVMKHLVSMVRAKRKYSTRTTGTTE